MSSFSFAIEKEIGGGALGRAASIMTPHGAIDTPAFIPVGTLATVKALTPEQVVNLGAQAVLANTYHLYLRPGEDTVEEAGGLGNFMGFDGPTMTDSGGFQVFSLGSGFGGSVSKLSKNEIQHNEEVAVYDSDFSNTQTRLARIDEDGVTFTSHIDGSEHRFTAERSIEIQHRLGADIIFAFDECTSSSAPEMYQKVAMERTHRWGIRSLKAHRQNIGAQKKQALYGIIQGGRFDNLRMKSAEFFAREPFDGYGIGGSFTKKDLTTSLSLVNKILPKERPRHLLGIGEPEDLFIGVENGADTFDCVEPTRIARTGQIYTKQGKINLLNNKYIRDFSMLDEKCLCYTCRNFTKAYLAHLFRSKEILGATLASIHNLFFIVNVVEGMRVAILEGRYGAYKENFFETYVS